MYNRYSFRTELEHSVEGCCSKVDYVGLVDGEPKALCDAISPSAMKKVGELLPRRGIELTWVPGLSLMPKILSKVSRLLLSVTTLFQRGIYRPHCTWA
jgi:hypothetical protein